MIGERTNAVRRKEAQSDGAARLTARALTVIEDDVKILDDVSLSVGGGEIVGVAGVAGSAQPALSSILAATRRPTTGHVFLGEKEITGRAGYANSLGLSFIPDERAAGIVLDLPVGTNASLLRLTSHAFQRAGLRRPRTEMCYGAEVCRRFGVRPPRPELLANSLSGGNQQKLLLGRELDREPAVIVAHSPTQGLDIAATAAAHNSLIEAATRGAAVVVISPDLDELIAIADRIFVLSAGRIVDEMDLRTEPFDAARVGRAMAIGQMPEHAE
jgi:simple sugar transport system ATP-binding protein